jgi:hypothetical protein
MSMANGYCDYCDHESHAETCDIVMGLPTQEHGYLLCNCAATDPTVEVAELPPPPKGSLLEALGPHAKAFTKMNMGLISDYER